MDLLGQVGGGGLKAGAAGFGRADDFKPLGRGLRDGGTSGKSGSHCGNSAVHFVEKIHSLSSCPWRERPLGPNRPRCVFVVMNHIEGFKARQW